MIDMDIPGPGKFEGNGSLEVSEYLYNLCGDSGFDEQFGDVSEGITWECLISSVTINGRRPRSYIVVEDTQGFFTYTEYISAVDAQNQYFRDLAAYESAYANGENL